MPEPLADRRKVDPGLQQKYGRRVPQGMRVNPLLSQGADCCGSRFDVLLEQVADAEASKFSALTVHEERRFAVRATCSALGELPQKPRGLRPNRA